MNQYGIDYRRKAAMRFMLYAICITLFSVGLLVIISKFLGGTSDPGRPSRVIGLFIYFGTGALVYSFFFGKWFSGLDDRKVRILVLRTFDDDKELGWHSSIAPLSVNYGRIEALKSPTERSADLNTAPSGLASLSATNNNWQNYISALFDEVELIVIFLNELSPGIEWELEQLQSSNLVRKSVIVTSNITLLGTAQFEHVLVTEEESTTVGEQLSDYLAANQLISTESVDSTPMTFGKSMELSRKHYLWPSDLANPTPQYQSRAYFIFLTVATYGGFTLALLALILLSFFLSDNIELELGNASRPQSPGMLLGLLPCVGSTVIWLSLWGAFSPKAFLGRSDVWVKYAGLGFKSTLGVRLASAFFIFSAVIVILNLIIHGRAN